MRPPSFFGNQALRDEVAERRRQAAAHRLLVRDFESADDAFDGLRGVDGVQRREDEVAGLRGGQRNLNRFAVAHFADENDFGRLSESGAQRQRERRRVGVQLALMHGALLVRMQELDRILDGEDVLGARLVDQVDDGSQRGRFAGPRWTGDEHDAVLELGAVGDGGRQAELGDRRNARRNHAHDNRKSPALAEDVDAETASFRQHIRQIGGAAVFQRPQHYLVVPDQVVGNARGVFISQRRQPVDLDLDELAVAFYLRRPSRREDQVADAAANVKHRLDDGIGGHGAGFRRAEQRRVQFCNCKRARNVHRSPLAYLIRRAVGQLA